MFIDGYSSKQRQNSTLLHSTNTNKPKLSSKIHPPNKINNIKTSSRKKNRRSNKILQQSKLSTNDDEDETSTYLASSEQDIQSINFVNDINQTTTNPITDITNQSINHGTILIDNHDEPHVGTVDVKSTNTNVSIQARKFLFSYQKRINDIFFICLSVLHAVIINPAENLSE